MEVFQIPEDTVHLMTKERLEEFAETFTLDSCRLQNNLLHITGSQTGLDSAKKLYKAYFLGLKKKLFQFTTVTIPLPKTVGEEDLKELLENKVDVCFGKSSLNIISQFGRGQSPFSCCSRECSAAFWRSGEVAEWRCGGVAE